MRPLTMCRRCGRNYRAGGGRWQITEFGDAYHAFTDPAADTAPIPGLAYDPLADRVSWAGTLALLEGLVKGA